MRWIDRSSPRSSLASLVLATALLTAAHPLASTPSETAFDPALAAELGADRYGMRRYVLVLLRSGPNRARTAEETARVQQGHMANIQRLAAEGTLVLAGPFIDSGELRGLFVFAVDSIEAARALTASDPAIASGHLEADYLPWYGSAALPALGPLHQRITEQNP